MLIRRNNWPAFLAIAIFGPLVGAFVGAKFLPLDVCPGDREIEKVQNVEAPSSKKEREWTLQHPDGDRVALDAIAPTRSVALVVMKGPWCPVCQKQLRRLSENLDRVQAAGGAVVGVTAATPERNAKLMEELDLNFPVVTDTSQEFLERVGLWHAGTCHPVPGVVFLDESGEIAKIHRGRYPGRPQGDFIVETLEELSQ